MSKKRTKSTESPNQVTNQEAIVKRLDIIIHLLLKQAETKDTDESARATEIKMLRDQGLTNIEIAAVLGKTESYISSALSKLKNKKKKRK
ncbi:MAG: hypothetical protein GY800_04770 [Planctomycetes bacterium]|nr:hypothetical protein [Planctomycetota bacterium]